jgi:tetratricopeptide (TPR) repeat protein
MNDWFEAEQRVERAQQLAESRQWAEALAEMDAAIAINADVSAWQANRGFILDQLERFDEAIVAFRTSVTLDAGDVEVLLALGIDLARMDRCLEAVGVLEQAARLSPDLEAAYCYRILAYSELGQHEKAEEMFYTAQQLVEDCPHCFYHMGGSLAARGLYDKAIYCWSRTLDIEPSYPGVRYSVAQAYREQGALDRAREYYVAELRQDPGNIELLLDMAELELEAGQLEKAAAKLRQVIELDPEYGHAHFALGEVMLELGQGKEALVALRAAGELEPEAPKWQLRMGQAFMMSNEFRTAINHLAAAHSEDPSDQAALLAWGNCLLRLGRSSEAADKFNRLLALDGSSGEAHHNLGVCCFLQGDYPSGLKHLSAALEIDPKDLVAMHKAVLVLLHMHRWREARAMIDRALGIDANDAALRELRDQFWRYRLRGIWHRVRAIGLRVKRAFKTVRN